MVLPGRPRLPNVLLSQDALLLLIACLGLQWGSVSVHILYILGYCAIVQQRTVYHLWSCLV